MNYSKYNLEVSSDYEIFEFVSKGVKGEKKKIVQFSATAATNLYNLGFGDKLSDGTLDDNSISNNGDMEMVLATVAATVYEYTSKYPERSVIFAGSSESRTRLYRMAVFKNFEELSMDFVIFGVIKLANGNLAKVSFIPDINYVAFIVSRKTINSFV
jgi:hypothetical protein